MFNGGLIYRAISSPFVYSPSLFFLSFWNNHLSSSAARWAQQNRRSHRSIRHVWVRRAAPLEPPLTPLIGLPHHVNECGDKSNKSSMWFDGDGVRGWMKDIMMCLQIYYSWRVVMIDYAVSSLFISLASYCLKNTFSWLKQSSLFWAAALSWILWRL